MTARILRAFVWLRWRVLVNALERTGSRDALERFSIAIENLGPIIALVLLVPSSIGLGVLGGIAGFGLSTGSWFMPFQVVRFFLLAAFGFALLGPVMLPARDSANPVRLLLLPIPRGVLFAGQLTATLADPWILLVVPATIGVPIGMALARDVAGAAAALLAGGLLLAALAALTALTGSIINLLLRDRRRADIVMLVLVLVLPTLGLLPSLQPSRSHRSRVPAGAEGGGPSAIERGILRAGAYVPSEIYQRTVIRASQRPAHGATGLALLAGLAASIHLLAFAAFTRVLDMPQTLGVRRAGTVGGGLWGRRVPGLSAASSAVALAHVRLVARTPRGRAIIVTPLLLFVVFGGGLFRRQESLAGIPLNSGIALATFAVFMSLLAVLPIAVNQFAIERAGFTRHLLLPITMTDLLAGKAVGNLLVTLPAALICFVLAAAIFRDGSLAFWASILPAYAATCAITAPVNAALSAIFPKAVDLSRIGKGSNPHQTASLLGLLTIVVSAAVPALLLLVAVAWLERPALAPTLILGWCVIAFAIAWLLFTPVARLVSRRRETLASCH